MGRPRHNDASDKIDSLLQRLKKQSIDGNHSNNYRLPPDEASAALGRRIGKAFCEQSEEPKSTSLAGDAILEALLSFGVNPSVPHSYFSTTLLLSSSSSSICTLLSTCLPRWILRCDQRCLECGRSGGLTNQATNTAPFETLSAAIQAYATIYAQHVTDTVEESTATSTDSSYPSYHQRLMDTYLSLQMPTSRACLIRCFLRAAFTDQKLSTVRFLLSPLMATSVLTVSSFSSSSSSSSSSTASTTEKVLFLDGIWRECWAFVRRVAVRLPNSNNAYAADGWVHGMMDVISWMTTSLHLFLCGIPGEPSQEHHTISMELSYQWLTQLADLTSYMAAREDAALNNHVSFSNWRTVIWRDIFPHFSTTAAACRISMETVLFQLEATIGSCKEDDVSSPVAVFRLSSMALATPLREEVAGIMNLLAGSCRINESDNITTTTNDTHTLLPGMFKLLACIHSQNNTCREAAKTLLHQSVTDANTVFTQNSERARVIATVTPERVTNIVQLLNKNRSDEQKLLQAMIYTLGAREKGSMKLTSVQQHASLLLGIGLLYQTGTDQELAYDYLEQLLKQFPQLGIPLLPVVMESIQSASSSGTEHDSCGLLRSLEFLCDAVVHDPTCAQQVWGLVGALGQPGQPERVRSTVIRLYPRLVRANKRLYRRVCDSLGASLADSPVQVRLAVAATLRDLAKDDQIRDVSDVIGWIQSFLSADDEHPSIVHFALLTLHHLVVAQELDFSVVVKVLKKRLCPVTSEDVLKLNRVTLEAFVVLLGDGECNEQDSSDDDDREEADGEVSPQVMEAVRVLIQLARSPALFPQKGSTPYSEDTVSRIQWNIYKSLSNYTLNALGICEDGLRAITLRNENPERPLSKAGERYEILTKIAMDGIELPLDDPETKVVDIASHPAVILAKKLVDYEEKIIGSSLWQKGGKASATSSSKNKRARASMASISALPSPDSVRTFYNQNPSTCNAVASLLCFGSVSSDLPKMLAQLSDISNDISDDTSDPLIIQTLITQGWIHAMGCVWSSIDHSQSQSKAEGLKFVIKEILGWRDISSNVDSALFALASLAIFIPDTFSESSGVVTDVDMSRFVEEIQTEVLDAYSGHMFENRDIAHVCLGLLGVRALTSQSMSQVDHVLEMLLKSLQGYSVNTGLGAYYGLAIIVQGFPAARKSCKGSADDIDKRICQIAGTLVDELLSCIDFENPLFSTLVACLKSGTATPDLLASISRVKELSWQIKENTRQKAKSLCLALGLCVPALATISVDLLLAVYRVLGRFAWGSGKGLAMPSILFACDSVGILDQHDMDKAIKGCTAALEYASEKEITREVEDIIYALVSITSRIQSLDQHVAAVVDFWIERILGDNSRELSSESRLQTMLATATIVGSVPCLANGAPLFNLPVRLNPGSHKEKVTKVVKGLFLICNDSGDTYHREAATLVLGLLSSMKIATAINDEGTQYSSLGRTGLSVEKVSGKTTSKGVDFSRIPQAKEGTALSNITGLVQLCCKKGESEESAASMLLAKLLNCYSGISLPSQFATNFLDPILSDPTFGTSDVKLACTKLLMSQIIGRRKAAFDGKEYLNVAIRISLLHGRAFHSILGKPSGPRVFISSLSQFLTKLPVESVGPSLENLLQICSDELKQKNQEYITNFLWSLRDMLYSVRPTLQKQTIQMSLRTITTIRRFVIDSVFRSLCSLQLMFHNSCSENSYKLLMIYVDCLKEIPIGMLDEMNLMGFTGSELSEESLMRVTCTMILARSGYFNESGRTSSEITKAVAWVCRQLVATPNTACTHALRRVAFEISFAAAEGSSAAMQDLVLLLLEALLLVTGLNRSLCLEFLAIVLGAWDQNVGSNVEFSLAFLFVQSHQETLRLQSLSSSSLKSIAEMLVHDLPWNLCTFCHLARMSGLITKQIWRIYKTWSEQGGNPHDVECLQQIFICCRGGETSEEDFAYLANSVLSQI